MASWVYLLVSWGNGLERYTEREGNMCVGASDVLQ
jgi:hypothetical protein